jgi:hypothetical protein
LAGWGLACNCWIKGGQPGPYRAHSPLWTKKEGVNNA